MRSRIRPQLDYGNIVFDQSYNEAFHENFGQLIEYNTNIFVEKPYTKCAGKTIPRPLSKKSKLSISLDPVRFWIQISVPACANQPSGFSIRGKFTQNGLFQTISGLKNIKNELRSIACSWGSIEVCSFISIGRV